MPNVVRRLGSRVLLALSPAMPGCALLTPPPTDLSFVSVQAVDLHDQTELPGPGASPLLGMVSKRVLEQIGQSTTGGPRPHRALLKVEFASATDLSGFVKLRSANLGVSAILCDHPNDRTNLSNTRVFWRGIELGPYEAVPVEIDGTLAGQRFIYYFFLIVSDRARPNSKPPEMAVDLRLAPEDVCFHLRGVNTTWGLSYSSNVAIVPKDAIALAFTRAPIVDGSN